MDVCETCVGFPPPRSWITLNHRWHPLFRFPVARLKRRDGVGRDAACMQAVSDVYTVASFNIRLGYAECRSRP